MAVFQSQKYYGFVLKIVIVLSILLVGVLSSSSVDAKEQHCHFPAVFNFGDSNSDTGGLCAAFGQVGSPHGDTFFKRPVGRFCDGRLVIDFIAESLGIPHLSAFLDSMGANFSHGANFATAGSTTIPQNTTLHEPGGFSPFSFNVQYSQFNDFYQRSQLIRNKPGGVHGNLLPKVEYFSRAIYTIDIGQNDLTSGYYQNMAIDQVKVEYVPALLTQFKNIVKGIYNVQGGRSFWIHSTGPHGCLPYMLELFPVNATQMDKVGCAIPYNHVAQFFNQKLKETVVQLRKELPEAIIVYVDMYSLKYDLIRNAKKYGFRNPFRVCCGYGGKYNYSPNNFCGAKQIVDGKEIMLAKACKEPSKVVNWDGAHYTEAANKWIFERIIDGSYSDPPMPLNMACHRH